MGNLGGDKAFYQLLCDGSIAHRRPQIKCNCVPQKGAPATYQYPLLHATRSIYQIPHLSHNKSIVLRDSGKLNFDMKEDRSKRSRHKTLLRVQGQGNLSTQEALCICEKVRSWDHEKKEVKR